MAVNAADYYRSLDDADNYFANLLWVEDWLTATDVEKEKGLLAAARAINSLVFTGYKVPVFAITFDGTVDCNSLIPAPTQAAIESADASQSKKWPRDGCGFAPDTPSTVQSLAILTESPTTGNVLVTVTLSDGVTFTTADIAFDGNTAAIQSAIDTAALLVVSGYAASDIVVAGGPLTTTVATLTFSGSSVSGKAHSTRPVVAAGTSYDGGFAVPSGSATITGECPNNIFFAQCEEAIKLIAGHDPQQAFENLVLSSDGVGSTKVTSDVSSESRRHLSHFFASSMAWKYLLPFLHEDHNSFGISRS